MRCIGGGKTGAGRWGGGATEIGAEKWRRKERGGIEGWEVLYDCSCVIKDHPGMMC